MPTAPSKVKRTDWFSGVADQAITEELRAWIVAQAQAGFAPDVVLKSMLASGWSEALALQAMETTLERALAQHPALRSGSQSGGQVPQGIPQARAVPQVLPPGDAPFMDTQDRRVQVLAQLRSPPLVLLGGLASEAECDALIEAATPRLARSLTVATKTGGEEAHVDRTSEGMFFTRGENEVVSRIEARLAALLNWPIDHGEGLQVLRYRPGAEYKPHHDYFDPQEPGTPAILARGGQRVATVILYLHQPAAGGDTVFPEVGLHVAPTKGNAVFFSYAQAHPASRSLHGGAPVVEGEKWIATKWLREHPFH
jgi:prolyl 4-hydroxylase